MLRDIVDAVPLENRRLRLRFDDGTSGVVDVRELVQFNGVFAPLADQTFFAEVRVNPELGTICWPNGADLDPQVLYAIITGNPLASHAVSA